jgi:putative oxidoreductase
MNTQASISHSSTPATFPRRVLDLVLGTRADAAAPVLRLALAVVMFPHGAQKVLGWFGGHGYEGTMGFLTQSIGLPAPLAMLVIALEFFGPLLLLVGFAVRPVALGLIGIMLGAIATVHAPFGFFMNWTGAQAGEGYEYHLLVIAMCLALAIRGAGSLSADGMYRARANSPR